MGREKRKCCTKTMPIVFFALEVVAIIIAVYIGASVSGLMSGELVYKIFASFFATYLLASRVMRMVDIISRQKWHCNKYKSSKLFR